MKQYYLPFIFILSSIVCLGQNKDGCLIVDSLNEEAWLTRKGDPNKAIKLAQRALKLSIGNYCEKSKGDAFSRIASAYRYLGNYDSSYLYYEKCLDIRKRVSPQKQVGFTYINLGQLAELKGEYAYSIDHFLRGIRVFKSISDLSRLAKCYNGLGYSQLRLGTLDSGFHYLKKAQEIYLALNDSTGLSNVLLSLGYLKEMQLNYLDAMVLYKEVINAKRYSKDSINYSKAHNNIGNIKYALNDYDSALWYYSVSKNVNTGSKDKGNVLNNMGVIYYSLAKYEKSYTYLDSALVIRKISGDNYGISSTYHNLANLYFLKGAYSISEKYLDSANYYSRRTNDIALNLTLLKSRARVLDVRGEKTLANEVRKRVISLSDSLDRKIASTNSLELKLFSENSKRQILQKEEIILQKHLENIQLKRREQTQLIWVLILGFILLIVVVIFIIFRLQHKRKSAEDEAKIAQKNEMITKLMSETSNNSLSTLIQVKDLERQKIARELHDNLGGTLATIRTYFKTFSDGETQEGQIENVQFEKANELLVKACKDVRDITSQMSGSRVKNHGLFNSLILMKEDLENSRQVKFNLNTFGREESLASLDISSTYRIIQELVTNALKHSKCSVIEVSINVLEQGVLNLIVEDNGQGFDIARLTKAELGNGLTNVKWRVENLKGKIECDSSRSRGTFITIDIPLK